MLNRKNSLKDINSLFDNLINSNDGSEREESFKKLKEKNELQNVVDFVYSQRKSGNINFKDLIDLLPINVMICDLKSFKISYINQKGLDELKKIENLLPIKADDVVGTCIDLFHKKPERQRTLLSDPSNLPYSTTFPLGDEVLELDAIAFHDENGKYIAPVATWRIVTSEHKMANEILSLSTHVYDSTSRIGESIHNLSASNEAVTESTKNLVSSSELSSNNIQSVAAAAEELSASIKEIRRRVDESSEKSKDATTTADGASKKVNELSEASHKIEEVIDLISDIAEQINLLALNATIEAARAGEAGKGFAVVASEVKNLASQTANATNDIADHIRSIQGTISETVENIENIASTINDLNEISYSVRDSVREQEDVTSEISRSITIAANGSKDVNDNVILIEDTINKNTEESNNIESAYRALIGLSKDMSEKVNHFFESKK